MADGRHIGNRNLAITPQPFIRSRRNFARSRSYQHIRCPSSVCQTSDACVLWQNYRSRLRTQFAIKQNRMCIVTKRLKTATFPLYVICMCVVCCKCIVTIRLKSGSYSVCDQTKPYVYCDRTTEDSNTSVVRYLSLCRLLRVYYDKTTKVGFIFSLRSNWTVCVLWQNDRS